MAKLKLTEKSVAALPPATTHASSCRGGKCACPLQTYYWDAKLVGFGVVVGRTGVKTFIARRHVPELQIRWSFATTAAPHQPLAVCWAVSPTAAQA